MGHISLLSTFRWYDPSAVLIQSTFHEEFEEFKELQEFRRDVPGGTTELRWISLESTSRLSDWSGGLKTVELELFALQLQRDFTYLVEEQGSTRGRLNASDPVPDRASKRASDVSEEFAFVQFLWDTGAINLYQRFIFAPAALVNRAGGAMNQRPGVRQFYWTLAQAGYDVWPNGVLRRRAEDSQFLGSPNKVGQRPHPHLLHDVTTMNLDGFFGCAQLFGDLLV